MRNQTSTAVSTVLTTVVSVNTVLTSTTVTASTSTTTTAITTVTQSSCPPPATPTCASVNPPSEYGYTFNIVYVGTRTLNYNNPGNDGGSSAPPLTYTYPGTTVSSLLAVRPRLSLTNSSRCVMWSMTVPPKTATQTRMSTLHLMFITLLWIRPGPVSLSSTPIVMLVTTMSTLLGSVSHMDIPYK